MKNDIYLIGGVGNEITLENIVNAVEKSDKTQPLNFTVHSVGGSVYEGIAIYKYLKNSKQEVIMNSGGLVASIASVFFLAAKPENRFTNSLDRFLIHLPIGGAKGNAKDLEATAKEMRKIEDELSDIYALETSMTKEEALAQMQLDEMMETSMLLAKGFVSEVKEFKAVAQLIIKNENKMSDLTEEKVEGLLDKFYNKFFKKEEPKNILVQDAAGVDIDFFELEEGQNVVVGSKANVDGSAADGEYLMPSGETYVFAGGELSEIKESEGGEDELENAKKRIEELEAELSTKNETIENKDVELVAATNKFTEVENKFTELRNEITGKQPDDKKENKKEEKENDSRKLFK